MSNNNNNNKNNNNNNNTTDKSKELHDIKTQFYAIMENYPTMYANSKMTPNLPSVMDAREKTDAALTSLHNRMFIFKSTLEKDLDDNEEVMAKLAKQTAQLNAKIARRTSILDSKDAMISQAPSTNALVQASNTQTAVIESFVNRATQLPGCKLENGIPTNCPCVAAGTNLCYSNCNKTENTCPATEHQISLVHEVQAIEKRAYIYAVSRIIYLVVGIAIISYFIFQTVRTPDSTILNDAKLKADQLKTGLTNKTTDVMNMNYMNMNRLNNMNPFANAKENANANALRRF